RGVPANPDQGEQQKANTKASVEHLVFCQRVLEEEVSAQGQQRHQQHGNLYLLASPDLLVQRLAGGFQVTVLCGFGGCCSGCWRGRRQIGVRELVIQVQRDKGFVFDAKTTLYQQLQSPGQNWVKGGGSRDLEQGCFFEIRSTCGFHAGQTLVIQVGEVKAVQVLDDFDAVKNPASHIARSLEGIQPIAHDQHGLL